MTIKEAILRELRDISQEFPNCIKEKFDDEFMYAFEQGYDVCQIKFLDLLVDSKLPEEEIVGLLQKHFDLRRSEVEDMIRTANNRKARKLSELK